MEIDGRRMESNMLIPDPNVVKTKAIVHIRIVFYVGSALSEETHTQGILGSSLFETAALTSGYGESSSISTASLSSNLSSSTLDRQDKR